MFTPGPWKAIEHDGRIFIDGTQGFVCSMDQPQGSEMQANARLIAAAPELLAALVAIRDGTIKGTVGGEDVVWFDQITTLHDFCDQLIGKATEARP